MKITIRNTKKQYNQNAYFSTIGVVKDDGSRYSVRFRTVGTRAQAINQEKFRLRNLTQKAKVVELAYKG